MKQDNEFNEWDDFLAEQNTEQEAWAQRLEQQLDGYEMSPSRDLWADIEARVALQQPAKPARVVPLWRRWAVAAAVAAFVVGGGSLLWINDSSISSQDSIQGMNASSEDSSSEDLLPDGRERSSTADLLPEERERDEEPPLPAVLRRVPVSPLADSQEAPREATPQSVAENKDQEEPRKNVPENNKDQEEPRKNVPENINRVVQPKAVARTLPRNQRKQLQLSLYASADLDDWKHENPVQMSTSNVLYYYYSYDSSGSRLADPIYLTGFEERQHHYQPVSLGLTASFPLTSRLSLSTGVVYTRLRSDFISITPRMTTESRQQLQYVGVPLNVQMRLWTYHSLHVYASAGVEADWNVKSKLTTNGVDQTAAHDHMQWSAAGTMGFQYDVLPRLGLYAEPGLRYYFDNGSNVSNFFKDKPTSMSLQMGLRLNM